MKKMTRVEKKKRRNKILFRLLLLFILIIIVTIFAFNSDFFNINYIIVEGNNKLDYDYIVNASLIDVEENIFRIKTSDAEKHLNKLPYVKDALVKRKLPNTVYINIGEREVAYQIKILSTYVLLDKEGYVLELSDEQVANSPIFLGFELSDIKVGESIFEKDKNINLYDFFLDDEIYNIITNMSAIIYNKKENTINIDLNSGIGVAFGPLDNVKYKIRLLDKILVDIEKKQIKCKMIIMNKGDNPILVTDD